MLASTSPDSALFVSWVDRIHKDALHTGVYNALIQAISPISVVQGTSSYPIIPASGPVLFIQVTNSGSGYTSAPTVALSGGGGTGATATAVLDSDGAGTVEFVILTAPGSGYTSNPTVAFSGGSGTGAAATAFINAYPSGTGIRRILLVYDRTFDRVLLPIESLVYPTNKGDSGSPSQPLQIPREMVTASTMEQWPEYYKREGNTNLIIFPAPQKAAFNGTYEVHYELQVPTLTATTSTLLIPDDGMDQVVAGVNAYVAQFLHLDTETQYWSQQYEALKRGTAIQ